MSKRSKKGFRKLENHELSEFTTLKGEESGSDSEMIDIEREDIPRRGGGLCCCCLALYVVLLSCVVVLVAMTGVYFGYNMMSISSEYRQRISSLETRVDSLEKSLADAGAKSESLMSQMTRNVSGVNGSVARLAGELHSHSDQVQKKLVSVEGNVGALQERMTAFESHPPTIGEDEVNKMRNNMAEFQGHLESYDSQLEDVKKTAGDATLQATKTDGRVELFERNLTSLRGGLDGLKKEHKETDSNLELLTLQVSALKIVVQGINETVLQEVNLTRDSINETKEELRELGDRLSALRDEQKSLSGSVGFLDSSLKDLMASVDQLHDSLHRLEAGTVPTEVPTEPGPTVATESPPPLPTTQPTTTSTTEPPTTSETPPPTTPPPTPQSPETAHTDEPATETEATTAASQPTQPESATTQENTVTPVPGSTGTSERATAASSTPSESLGEGGNQSSNEEGPSPSTPTPPLSSPAGTQTASDSTGATEDIPSSEGHNSTSSSSSEQGSSSDSLPEEQPPTAENQHKDLEDTIMKLNDLLLEFTTLDADGDGALEYDEFSQNAGDTLRSRRVFGAMDTDGDRAITYEEIADTIQMLERKTTEGTEDFPIETDDETTVDRFAVNTNEEETPGTPTQPHLLTEPTPPTTFSESESEDGTSEPAGPQSATGPQTEPDTTTTVKTESDTSTLPGSDATTDAAPLAGGGGGDGSKVDSGAEKVDSEGPGSVEATADEESKKKLGALATLRAIEKDFHGLDTNGDGRLTDYEFSSYFSDNNKMVANIFSFLDVDGDFFVTYDEISRAIAALSTDEKEVTEASPEDELADYIHGDTNF